MFVSMFGHDHAVISQGHAGDRTIPSQRTETLHFPSLTTTVPKELVHRAAVAEVFLTDWVRIDDTRFTVLAQWPRSHSFFTPLQGGYHDPLIVAETTRQIGPLLAHAEFNVPLGHQFLLSDLNLTVCHEEFLVGDTPASLEIEVSCSDLKLRGGKLYGFHWETVIRQGGRVAATSSATLTCLAPEIYRRVRNGRVLGSEQQVLPLTAPTAPQTVGRMSPMDVVLSPVGKPDCWQLRVDTRHPVIFDHPLDHIPGMLLMEAARQAWVAAQGSAIPLGIATEFHRWAELDAPCTIRTTRIDEDTLVVTGWQDDESVFTATMTGARRTS